MRVSVRAWLCDFMCGHADQSTWKKTNRKNPEELSSAQPLILLGLSGGLERSPSCHNSQESDVHLGLSANKKNVVVIVPLFNGYVRHNIN